MFELLETISALALLIFVIGSMASMGLSLTMQQIIDPLKNVRLVVLALLGNYVLVPIAALVISMVFPLEEYLRIGLICMAAAAGIPFLNRLAQFSGGSTELAVSLSAFKMVVTIFYMPLAIPLMVEGVAVYNWEMAQMLIMLMLIPLVISLLIRARWEKIAAHLQPIFARASSFALIALISSAVILNFQAIVGVIGSWGILAAIIFIFASLVIGLLLGGSDSGTRNMLGLSTGMRNVPAAIIVGAGFGSDVIAYSVLVALMMLFLMTLTAGELGKRAQGKGEPAEPVA